jgi:hypothetical protein
MLEHCQYSNETPHIMEWVPLRILLDMIVWYYNDLSTHEQTTQHFNPHYLSTLRTTCSNNSAKFWFAMPSYADNKVEHLWYLSDTVLYYKLGTRKFLNDKVSSSFGKCKNVLHIFLTDFLQSWAVFLANLICVWKKNKITENENKNRADIKNVIMPLWQSAPKIN